MTTTPLKKGTVTLQHYIHMLALKNKPDAHSGVKFSDFFHQFANERLQVNVSYLDDKVKMIAHAIIQEGVSSEIFGMFEGEDKKIRFGHFCKDANIFIISPQMQHRGLITVKAQELWRIYHSNSAGNTYNSDMYPCYPIFARTNYEHEKAVSTFHRYFEDEGHPGTHMATWKKLTSDGFWGWEKDTD